MINFIIVPIMIANVFFDIPKVQQVDLLSQWLRLADIAALDSATCCKKLRPEFLELLSSPELTLGASLFFRDSFCDWTILRNVSFSEADLGSSLLSKDDTRDALLKVLGRKLTSLGLHCEHDGFTDEDEPPLQIDQIMFDVTQHCTSLRNIIINYAVLDGTLSFLIHGNQFLEEVSLHGCSNITPSTLKSIIKLPRLNKLYLLESFVADVTTMPLCEPNLKCQMLDGRYCRMKPNVLFWLCQSMPNLLKIYVDVQTGRDLECIASHCRHVTRASITLETTLSLPEVRGITKHWQSIELLTLLRPENKKHLPVCDESVMLHFVNKCRTLLQLKLAPSDPATAKSGTLYYSRITYSDKNAALSKTDDTRSRLTDLFVPSLTALALATIVTKCVYLNTLRIVRPVPIVVDMNAAEFALHHLSGTSVKTLILVNCSNLEHTHLLPLQGMVKLVLCNTGLSTLTSSRLVNVLQKSPELNALYLHNCPGIDHNILLSALEQCTTLAHFEYYAKEKEQTSRNTDPAVTIMTTLVRKMYPNLKHFAARF